MINSTLGPYVAHNNSHFPVLRWPTEPHQWSYIPDKTLADLEEAIRTWFNRVISGKASYASPGEPPVRNQHV